MKETWLALAHSRKFWLALLAFAQTVVFQFYPQFPAAVWQSTDALVAVLIAAIAVEDAAANAALGGAAARLAEAQGRAVIDPRQGVIDPRREGDGES